MAKNKRQRAENMARRGASQAKIERKTGVSTKAASNFVAKYAPSPQPSQQTTTPQPSTPQTNTPVQPKLTRDATKDGRYGVAAQRAARDNYYALQQQGVTDAFNPGKPGSRSNITADGFVGKNELKKFARQKDIDASKARKRLASKGAAFASGANRMADSAFAKSNPFLAMMIQNGMDTGIYGAGGNKNKNRQMQIFKDSTSFDYKNRLPGEVFAFRPKSGMEGAQPVRDVDRLNKIFGNPIVGVDDLPKTDDEEKVDDGSVAAAPVIPPEEEEEEETDPGVGQMSGGGLGAMGATKLGAARSRLRRLGILNAGTGLLGRSLQYGNTINA